jgi:hypothetical protein
MSSSDLMQHLEGLTDAAMRAPNSEFSLQKRALQDLAEGKLARPPFQTASFVTKSFDSVNADLEFVKLRADQVTLSPDLLESFSAGIDSTHTKSVAEIQDQASATLDLFLKMAAEGLQEPATLRKLAEAGELHGDPE